MPNKKTAVKKSAIKKTVLVPVKKTAPAMSTKRQLIISFFFDGQPYNHTLTADHKLTSGQLLAFIQEECFDTFEQSEIDAINEKLAEDSPRASSDDIHVICIYELL